MPEDLGGSDGYTSTRTLVSHALPRKRMKLYTCGCRGPNLRCRTRPAGRCVDLPRASHRASRTGPARRSPPDLRRDRRAARDRDESRRDSDDGGPGYGASAQQRQRHAPPPRKARPFAASGRPSGEPGSRLRAHLERAAGARPRPAAPFAAAPHRARRSPSIRRPLRGCPRAARWRDRRVPRTACERIGLTGARRRRAWSAARSGEA